MENSPFYILLENAFYLDVVWRLGVLLAWVSGVLLAFILVVALLKVGGWFDRRNSLLIGVCSVGTVFIVGVALVLSDGVFINVVKGVVGSYVNMDDITERACIRLSKGGEFLGVEKVILRGVGEYERYIYSEWRNNLGVESNKYAQDFCEK